MRHRFLLGGLLLAALFLALVPRTSHAQSLECQVSGFLDPLRGYQSDIGLQFGVPLYLNVPYTVDVTGTLSGVPGVGVFAGLPGISKALVLAAEWDYDTDPFNPTNDGYHVKGEKSIAPSVIWVGLPGLQLTALGNYPSTDTETFWVVNEDEGYYRWMGQVFADREGGGLPPEAPSTAFSTDGGVLWATCDYWAY